MRTEMASAILMNVAVNIGGCLLGMSYDLSRPCELLSNTDALTGGMDPWPKKLSNAVVADQICGALVRLRARYRLCPRCSNKRTVEAYGSARLPDIID